MTRILLIVLFILTLIINLHAQLGIEAGYNFNYSIIYRYQSIVSKDIDSLNSSYENIYTVSNYKPMPSIGINYNYKKIKLSIYYQKLNENHHYYYRNSNFSMNSFSEKSTSDLLNISIGINKYINNRLTILFRIGFISSLGQSKTISDFNSSYKFQDTVTNKFKYYSGSRYGLSSGIKFEYRIINNFSCGLNISVDAITWKPRNMEILSYKVNGVEGIQNFPLSSKNYYLIDECRSDLVIPNKKCLPSKIYNYSYLNNFIYLKYSF